MILGRALSLGVVEVLQLKKSPPFTSVVIHMGGY